MSNEVNRSKPVIRKATIEDCLVIAPKLREEDVAELWHSSRSSPIDAAIGGLSAGECFVFERDGKPIVIFGVIPYGTFGLVWAVATPEIKTVRKAFHASAKRWVNEMSSRFTALGNMVWAKNTEHISWLHRLGFTFHKPEPFGPDKELFQKFVKETYV